VVRKGILWVVFLCLLVSSVSALTIKDIVINPQQTEVGQPVEFLVLVNSDLKISGVDGILTYPDGSETTIRFETKDELTFTYLLKDTRMEGGYGLNVVASDEKESVKAFAKFEVVPIPEPTPIAVNTTLDVVKNDTNKIITLLNISQDKMEDISANLSQIAKNTQKSVMSLHGTEYTAGQTAKVWLQLLNSTGLPIEDAVCFVDIYTPDNQIYVERATMTNFLHDGIYYYDLAVPIFEGVYPVIAICYYDAIETPNFATNITMINGSLDGGTITDTNAIDSTYLLTTETPLGLGNPRRYMADFRFNNSDICNVSPLLLNGITISWQGRWNSIASDPMAISIYNYTSASWVNLPNTIVGSGTGTKSATNSLAFNNITTAGLRNSTNGEVKLRFNDTANTDTSSTGFDTDFLTIYCDQLGDPEWQEVRGSAEIHISASSTLVNNQYVWINTCEGYTDGRCAIMTDDGEFPYTEGEFEEYLNFTALITQPNTNIIYDTPPSVDCSAIYWIKQWNGTDWVNFTHYTSYSKTETSNCEIDINLNITNIQDYSFWLKYDNYMKWEVEYSKDVVDSIYSQLPALCDDRNFTYFMPILDNSTNSTDPITLMCARAYDDFWWAENYYNLSLLATTAGEYSPYLVEMRLYREEMYRRYTFLKNAITSPQQVTLLNQILTYLNSTIYPYLQTMWNKLLGIETQLNTTINITNQSLVLDTEINTTTHTIDQKLDALNTTMLDKFTEKDAHIQSAYDNMTSQVTNLSNNVTQNFNQTWEMILALNLSQGQDNSVILSYLANITTAINNTQTQIANVNQSLNEQILNTTNSTQNLILAVNTSTQNRFDEIQEYLNNLTLLINTNHNITQENISVLMQMLLDVNSSITSDIDNLNTSLQETRTEILTEINKTYNYLVSVNQSISNQINQTGDTIIDILEDVNDTTNEIIDILEDMNNTIININETNNWILQELNISGENLTLNVVAPTKCLVDTNWLVKARVTDRFGTIQTPLDGMRCNMTTDLWGTSNMTYLYVEDKFKYIHVCDPAYTTFNWSVECGWV
jgi:hypothetical protein